MAELSAIWGICSYLRGTTGGKVLRMDAGTGQEHLKRRNLYRQQRTQQADKHFLQEQEKDTQAAGGMVPSGEYPRSHYLQESLWTGAGTDRQPPQTAKERYHADLLRSGEVCGLRMVDTLWYEQTEQQALQPLHLQSIRTGVETMFCPLYPL